MLTARKSYRCFHLLKGCVENSFLLICLLFKGFPTLGLRSGSSTPLSTGTAGTESTKWQRMLPVLVSSSCELRSIIKFPTAKTTLPNEICREIKSLCNEVVEVVDE